MDQIAKGEVRAYRSDLRARQAEGTRARILDATLHVMARGVASLSIPAVAREAGVSVPTVYRHFGTKEELLAAVYPHVARRVGFDTVPDPLTIDELRGSVRAYFERLDSYSALDLAAVASPLGDDVRHLTIAHRLDRLARFADAIDPPLARPDRDRVLRLLVVLTASASLRMWRDHLGAPIEQAVDDIVRAVEALIATRGGTVR